MTLRRVLSLAKMKDTEYWVIDRQTSLGSNEGWLPISGQRESSACLG
jgi:hypothetical protein